MKKLSIIGVCLWLGALLTGCGGAHGDDPGHAYMPDMYYSRAYETYGYNDVGGEYDTLKKRGISYNGMNVPGTIARGEHYAYHLTGDSTGEKNAAGIKNPLDTLAVNKIAMKEAERLYLVNCGICHGTALDGNGPIYNNGNGPYPAKPRELNGDYVKNLTDGHIFYVITFGKNAMGSYASQLTPEQRWWVVKYIRSKNTAPAASKDSTGKVAASGSMTAKKDSAKTK